MSLVPTDDINVGVIDENLAEYILRRNKTQGELFTTPSAELGRKHYHALHPTRIIALKCMDGRIHLPLYTETPPGIIQPFRNIGGRFDLGWPFFQELIRDEVNFSVKAGREFLLMSSYHFSKDDTHRGCAGFSYDTEAARQQAFKIEEQFCHAVGGAVIVSPVAFALTIGIETDNEALLFHGKDGSVMDLAELSVTTSENDIEIMLRNLYPRMSHGMVRDLIPLIKGNIRHIEKVRRAGKAPVDLEHREQVIAVGRGFDWLHLPNTALIVGPYSHAWPEYVRVAGTIVLDNIRKKRIPESLGALLLIVAHHRQDEGAFGRALKREKVRYLKEESLRALKEGVPELMKYIQIVTGVVSAETQHLELIERT